MKLRQHRRGVERDWRTFEDGRRSRRISRPVEWRYIGLQGSVERSQLLLQIFGQLGDALFKQSIRRLVVRFGKIVSEAGNIRVQCSQLMNVILFDVVLNFGIVHRVLQRLELLPKVFTALYQRLILPIVLFVEGRRFLELGQLLLHEVDAFNHLV